MLAGIPSIALYAMKCSGIRLTGRIPMMVEWKTLTYRNLIKGEVIYVSMKIVKLRSNDNDIIIGINNVDAQMKHEEELEKIREERLTYSRIKALSGEYVAVYLVDPQTDEYTEYSSTDYYDSVGLSKSGYNFYEKARQEAPDALFSEDSDGFIKRFRKEVILKDIKSKGVFTINYRLMIKGMPVHVQLRATLIKEPDSDKLIMGVLNIDDIVKREQEYVSTISAIKAEVDRDGLTGVKSKHAYVDAESSLDKLIDEGNAPEFALAVFDINGLKEINDTLGHQAGDQYIIDGCEMICKVFKRSPVFRIGGDEFVVIARGADYARADELMEKIAKRNRKNHKLGKVVVAAGMAKFTKEKNVASVFKRADDNMYKNKRNLKKGK